MLGGTYGGSAAAAGLARMRDVEHALKALEATLRERDDATLKHAEERALFMKALGWATMDHAGGNGLTSFDATPMANQMTAALANEPPFITVLLNDALLSGRAAGVIAAVSRGRCSLALRDGDVEEDDREGIVERLSRDICFHSLHAS